LLKLVKCRPVSFFLSGKQLLGTRCRRLSNRLYKLSSKLYYWLLS